MPEPLDTEDSESPSRIVIETIRRLPGFAAVIATADPDRLRRIAAMLQWFSIPAGTTLFEEGEAASDAFLLLEGRLNVLVAGDAGAEAVAQIEPGEIVGEMSLISGEARSATVVASRDSQLVRVPGEAFDLMLRFNSEMTFLILRDMAERIRRTSRSRGLSPHIDSIAIVPLSDPLLDDRFPANLVEAFAAMGRAVSVHRTPDAIRESSPASPGEPLRIYFADYGCTAWTRHAIRQSDRVVFVANADAQTSGAAIPAVPYAAELHRAADLVVINEPAAPQPAGGTTWLAHFPGERILHVRKNRLDDAARIARLTLRRAIGIVFSGGGARGFAHAGVIKALMEAGIPIDLAGGTSFGAVVAALAALDLSPSAILEGLYGAFVKDNPFTDYTVPVIALSRGRNMNRLLRTSFADAHIENLWKTFFCVSANLSTGETMVHSDGLLRRGLRASCAVPGIVPPAILNGEILVDGGIMNNFPTNVMAARRRGLVIGVDITGGSELRAGAHAAEPEEKSLLWLLSKGRKEVPGILRILSRSGTVNGVAQVNASRAATDVLIEPAIRSVDMLAWRSWELAVEQGYRAAMEAMERIREFIAKPLAL